MNYSDLRPAGLALLCLTLVACGDDGSSVTPDDGGSAPMDARADAGPASEFVASCVYENAFAGGDECKEYRGAGWTAESAAEDCDAVFLTLSGELSLGTPCAFESEIGRCVVGDVEAEGYVIVSQGDASACGGAQTGCETFAGGTFSPTAICASQCESEAPTGQAFVPPYLDCRAPLAGEAPGQGPEGQVCTQTLISASTEEGRFYPGYADCDVVRSQRPYYAEDAEVSFDEADPRLADADYMANVAWMKGQAEASACACCHTASTTPAGASIWDTEAGPLWIDTFSDEALAMIGGFTDSAAFGYYPAEANNGFDRSTTGLPTTDVERLRAFVAQELERRGISTEEAAELEPFAPFFRDLIEYEPEACADGLGVDADGVLTWTGGGARYVYVLEADARSPGVAPNWDLPEGTRWALSVPPESASMGCDITYGELPEGVTQRFPVEGAPSPLVSGETYYLAVMRDIAQPITRCLFEAP